MEPYRSQLEETQTKQPMHCKLATHRPASDHGAAITGLHKILTKVLAFKT